MNDVFECIDQQLDFNKGKNLFYSPSNLDFIKKTNVVIKENKQLFSKYQDLIVNYICEKVLMEFCRINQYYSFDQASKIRLRELYIQLMVQLSAEDIVIDEISKKHYENLKEWLSQSNPVSVKIYNNQQLFVQPIVCSEYSAEFQCEVLNIEPEKLVQPIFDIGCGKDAHLLRFFHRKGIKAFGIDRFESDFENSIVSDWLNYNYGFEKWGTIISNMAFSNHFVHHHFKKDGEFLIYATKYMEILNSLKVGGSFYYSPDLPFIETFLEPSRFILEKFKIRDDLFFTSRVKRLK